MRFRPSIRVRLTAWYATVFFVGGVVLLSSAYWIVRHNIAVYPQKVDRELRPPAFPARAVPARRPGDPDMQKFLRLIGVARARAEQQAQVRTNRRVGLEFLGILLVTTAGSIATGYLVAGRVMRPVARITTTARRVSETSLNHRIALNGPDDELKELADTFDSMLERLEGAFASQRDFVSNASHELMTPLAIIRAELDATLGDPHVGAADVRRMAAVVEEAVARSESLIASLLVLARGERGLERRTPVDLAEIAARVVDGRLDAASEKGVRVERSLLPAGALGDESLIEALVANLVDNGIRYNESGGVVAISTRLDADATLSVSNSGPQIAPASIERLWQPFFRADRSRSRATGGNGLGLAIVRAIATAHGGRATAVARPGGGLDVTVSLPHRRPTDS
jgi:signal transduction histidine kinase